jgi:rare lipoprotein A
MNKIFIVFCVVVMLFFTACHRKSISSKGTKNCEETGMASYYGGKYIGRPTASGEIFVADKLTAAHKTLPFGTMVKVTNLSNNKSVIVRINDRGPFVKGRIIDLSELAAKKIDMMQQGIVKVTIICTK